MRRKPFANYIILPSRTYCRVRVNVSCLRLVFPGNRTAPSTRGKLGVPRSREKRRKPVRGDRVHSFRRAPPSSIVYRNTHGACRPAVADRSFFWSIRKRSRNFTCSKRRVTQTFFSCLLSTIAYSTWFFFLYQHLYYFDDDVFGKINMNAYKHERDN